MEQTPLIWRHGTSAVPYTLHRTGRRRTSLIVSDQGLSVRTLPSVPMAEIVSFMNQKADWILEQLIRHNVIDSQGKLIEKTSFGMGAHLFFLGRKIEVKLTGRGGAWGLDEDVLSIPLAEDISASLLKRAVRTWFIQEAQSFLSRRLASLSSQSGIHYRAFSLSNAKTRWGSCNAKGEIRLSWRLMFLRKELIDYVIMHELAHILELNHGPRFYAHLRRLCPQFEVLRQEHKKISIDFKLLD